MDRWEALIAAAARRSEPPRSGWAEWGGGGGSDARATAIPSRCPPRPRPVAAGGRGEGGGRMRGRGGEEGTWKSHGRGERGAERAGAVVAPPRAADAAGTGTGTGRNAVAVNGGAAEDVVVIVSGRRSVGEPTLDVSEMLLQAAETWRSRRTQREARPDALPPRPVAADGRGGSGEGTSRARGRGEEGMTQVAVAGGLATLTHGGERDPGAAVATEEKRNGGEVGTKRGLEERAARSPPPLPPPKRRAVSAVRQFPPGCGRDAAVPLGRRHGRGRNADGGVRPLDQATAPPLAGSKTKKKLKVKGAYQTKDIPIKIVSTPGLGGKDNLVDKEALILEDDDILKALAVHDGTLKLYLNASSSVQHHGQHGCGNADDRRKTMMLCRRFQFIRLALVHAVKQGSLKVLRADLEADKIVRKLPSFIKPGPIVGNVRVVEVGDEFLYRVELALVGLHRPY
ncbi:hypothetical protein OsI_29148 [Oryza sativa Indica Group]|uniref:YDG domain-containing protein n=1 Tax=Oryza sativa subsp. indica TaxID=39946 RepID=A2YUZ8_ORYSI|nr:hypothetical protein OsI_29148 [Oryza sativa Indica Group]